MLSKHIRALLVLFSFRYYYNASNFLIRVNVNGKEDILYQYSPENSGLTRVTNPDLTWIEHLYNADGLYAGIKHYSSQNVLLRGVQYKDNGPGEVQMIEHPKKSILKYNIYVKLGYIKKEGCPVYRFINDKEWTTTYYVDDLVKKCLISLIN